MTTRWGAKWKEAGGRKRGRGLRRVQMESDRIYDQYVEGVLGPAEWNKKATG